MATSIPYFIRKHQCGRETEQHAARERGSEIRNVKLDPLVNHQNDGS